MDEFVEEIQSYLSSNQHGTFVNKNNKKLRDMFIAVCSSVPTVKITIPCDEDGNVTFEASMGSAEVSYEFFEKYKGQMHSNYIANFIGELIVRENIDTFAKIMLDLKDDYLGTVNKFQHRTFGMMVHNNKFIFKFHISLIESIMAEDLKRVVNQ